MLFDYYFLFEKICLTLSEFIGINTNKVRQLFQMHLLASFSKPIILFIASQAMFQTSYLFLHGFYSLQQMMYGINSFHIDGQNIIRTCILLNFTQL